MRAFLVLGPESSGTRLVTRLLISAGCFGDGDHWQRLDRVIPPGEELLVWRRSMPHAKRWPDICALVSRLRGQGYEVHAVVTMRDWWAMMNSQVIRGHVTDLRFARANIQHAYTMIFNALERTEVDCYAASYESLVQRPVGAVERLYECLGLSAGGWEEIYDANERYF